MNILRKLFFDTSEKDVKAIQPIVDQINALDDAYSKLSDAELRGKTDEFKQMLRNGKKLDQILPDAFAAVREASRRTLGMRQFDVQMIGGVVLHQGRIAEMKTGEGKTLVAVAPLYLNALTGKGAHLVTVNDYLARRDAVWMGPIYDMLGLSLGIIQGMSQDSDELGGSYRYQPGAMHDDPRYANLVPVTRREAYSCDITYGTNHEFGFDYLRDNMAFNADDLVMTELNFAIIDEVDSILIDEARTPHIISGPSNEDVSIYREVDAVVKQLEPEVHYTVDKKNHSASLTEEGMDAIEQIMGIDNIAGDPKLFHHVNAAVKAYGLFDRDVEYVVRSGEVVIVDENTGRMMFGRRFSDGLHQALEAKEGVTIQRESQTVATITFQNLFRLYNKLAGMTGTAKTEEDEFRKIYGLDVVTVPTHRPMIRVDHPDSIFKTQEAKFRGIAWEILRLSAKEQPVLVGTRSIEMSEKVSERLTADMLQRLMIAKRLQHMLETEKSVPKEYRDDVSALIEKDLKDMDRSAMSMLMPKLNLSADATHEDHVSWFLSLHSLDGEQQRESLLDALKNGIPHNVLNAKYHEREALIIAEAGRKGAVTIATNMAGRGVDILLGGRVEDASIQMARKGDGHEEELDEQYGSTFTNFRRGSKERAAPPLPLSDQERSQLAEEVRALGGLYILGTERHESRRIDNQLRGRAGRQGDPGESKFFVSLEDQLWKIFNANMLENPMVKAWPPLEEVNAKFLSKMIQRTQERIENHFFEARKHVLEYDDVLNAQREHIYGIRREVLLGKDVRQDLKRQVSDLVKEVVDDAWMTDESGRDYYDYAQLYEDLNGIFPLVDFATTADLEKTPPGPALVAQCQDLAQQAYDRKVEEVGDEIMRLIEQNVMLRAVNDRWMDHLQTLEYIREGISLRGYGQVDPLVAYKKEAFELFNQTVKAIRDQAVKMIFRAQVQVQQQAPPPAPTQMLRVEDVPEELKHLLPEGEGATAVETKPAPVAIETIDWSRVGRNDLCPCGSGKKFKACHYPELRAKGVI